MWSSHGQAEVDFVIEDSQGRALPIEVKLSDNVRSRNLGTFCGKYEPEVVNRLSPRSFGYEGAVRGVPLHAEFCLDELYASQGRTA